MDFLAVSLLRVHSLLLCAARDPQVAKECLEQYDAQIAKWTSKAFGAFAPHRVSERFCGTGSALQQAFRAHAAGGGISELLEYELAAYENGAVDETPAEGEHRNATHHRKRAPGSRFTWWAATCRMEANLAAADRSIENDGGKELLVAWHGWKSLVRAPRNGRHVLRPERVKTQAFVNHVYRLGEVGLEEWDTVCGPLKDKSVRKAVALIVAE